MSIVSDVTGMNPLIIVLAFGRTGSNLLSEIIASHPQVCRPPQSTELRHFTEDKFCTIDSLENYMSQCDVPEGGCILCKYMKCCGPDTLIQILEKYRGNYGLIHMRRNDMLARCVSLKMLEKTGLWGGKSYPRDMKVNIDPEELQKHNQWMVDQNGLFRETLSHAPHVEVWYEDFVSDRDFYMGQVANYLGITNEFSEPKYMKKQEKLPLEDRVENFNELQGAMRALEIPRYMKDVE